MDPAASGGRLWLRRTRGLVVRSPPVHMPKFAWARYWTPKFPLTIEQTVYEWCVIEIWMNVCLNGGWDLCWKHSRVLENVRKIGSFKNAAGDSLGQEMCRLCRRQMTQVWLRKVLLLNLLIWPLHCSWRFSGVLLLRVQLQSQSPLILYENQIISTNHIYFTVLLTFVQSLSWWTLINLPTQSGFL